MLLKCFDRQTKNTFVFFPLSLFISSSASSASYVEAQELSSNFKCSAKVIYIYVYRERKRDTSGDFYRLVTVYSISNTEGDSFSLLTQLLIQVQILTLMNDAITVKRWALSLIHYASNPS